MADDGMPSPPLPTYSTAGFFSGAPSERHVLDFDPGWRFLKGEAAGAEASSFDDAAWQVAHVPHGLEIVGENASGMRNYQGPAWYRKHFSLSAQPQEGHVFLYFEAIMGKCKVWVNGREVAEHFGGYLPFVADVTDALASPGQDNVVAVRADNSDDDSYPPGKPQKDLDFTYMGGIYRDVFLIETGGVHVTFPELSSTVAGGGVFVATKDLTDGAADLEVRTEVQNQTTGPRQLTLHSVLEDASQQSLWQKDETVSLPAGQSQELTDDLQLSQPHLWTPNDPYLHFLRTDVIENGVVVDSLRTRFGIRLFSLKSGEGLYLNGKPIGYKISGANRHQDYVYVGNALPKSGQWRDAKLLREGGCTFIRSAHYPMSPAFLDACDVLGLLVTDANPGWQFYNSKNPLFDQRVIEDSHNMVRRDRNRPAMLTWETALNETSMPPDLPGRMSSAAHAEYPFPGFFTSADPGDAIPAGMDLPYFNPHWNKALPDPAMPTFQREIGDWVDNFSNQNSPVRINRAWGEHALNLQAKYREEMIDELYGRPPQMIGAALWAGIDHQRGYNPDPFWGGLLDAYRIPRYSYFLYKSQYDPDLKVSGLATGPMVYICNELTYISDPDVVVYTNCQQVRLTWLGKEYGPEKPDPAAREPHPPIVFKNIFDMHPIGGALKHDPLVMVAEGLINGQVVCRQVKTYAQRTVGLHLEVDDAGVPLQADGSDFVPVRAYVVDQFGIMKVLESAYVKFQAEGPGGIIGGEENHGNPMKTEFGEATALVRAGLTAGTIRVTASAEGLHSDSIEIQSVPPALLLLFDAAFVKASAPAPAFGYP